MRIRVLYHDHCFDGAASAAYFSRFYGDVIRPGAKFVYTGMAHKADQLFEDSLFDGEVNAIVDFKYSPSPKLDWWFDHHQSAFLTPEDAEHFRREAHPRKMLDTSFRSCAKFIASWAKQHHGYDPADLHELVEWADIIDGALYRSAEEAVGLAHPAMKLVLIIEAARGSDVVQQVIRRMQRQPLHGIMDAEDMQALYRPLHERHLRSIEIIRRQAKEEKQVVFFDLIEDGLDGYNKFIPYYLFPDSVYTVSVSQSSFRTKVSVGSNPWVKGPLAHNLASICESYGGGGHPRVGAISFPIGAFEEARKAAAEILTVLRG